MAEAEVLADRHALAPSAPTSTSSMNSLGRALGELGVEGDHDQLLHAQRGDQLGLSLAGVVSSLGVCWGATTDTGCGSKVSTAVRACDHLAVAEMHAVERAHRHAAALAALDVGQAE